MSQSNDNPEKLRILLIDFYNANEPENKYLHSQVKDLVRNKAYEVTLL